MDEQTLMCFSKRLCIILSLDEFIIKICDLNGGKSKHYGTHAYHVMNGATQRNAAKYQSNG